MKFSLFMIMYSYVAGECMPPHQMPTKYNDLYSCMNAGYQESLDKTKEIGADQVNEHQIYLKFVCQRDKIKQEGEPT